MHVKELTASELCDYLKENVPSLSESVVHEIDSQRIDGEALLQITEMSDDRYLREIAPLLGDRIKLRAVISKPHQQLQKPVRHSYCA